MPCIRPCLDASSHLYKRSVGPVVRNAFVKIVENGIVRDEDASYVMYMAFLAITILPINLATAGKKINF